MPRSERTRNLVAVALITASLAVIAWVLASTPAADEDRVRALATRLKCPVCESESIADSPAELSRELYALIEERVDQGWSDDEIVAFFVSTYGEEVLLDPPGDARTALLWVLPLVAAGIGVALVLGRSRRAEAAALTDEERARVARALEERRRREAR